MNQTQWITAIRSLAFGQGEAYRLDKATSSWVFRKITYNTPITFFLKPKLWARLQQIQPSANPPPECVGTSCVQFSTTLGTRKDTAKEVAHSSQPLTRSHEWNQLQATINNKLRLDFHCWLLISSSIECRQEHLPHWGYYKDSMN